MCIHVFQSLSYHKLWNLKLEILLDSNSRDSDCRKERMRLRAKNLELDLRNLEIGPQLSLLPANTHHHLHYDIFCMSAFSFTIATHYSKMILKRIVKSSY